ncbi:RagB/SusD family nutrient uptake outer membrane protein [Psychroflexus tropicus]|uniref:RagB/SusD family nutrient uptake outer membrane protein n=1 Tax=Psychroflexus tropicus TaxID=197345 RepID=UPI00036A6EA7|nr:RagB/SusD family nutrient uptake outer membrane protein [Psychroflexus tropicus]
MFKNKTLIKAIYLLGLVSFLASCESFVEVDVPNDRITGETLFTNNRSALSALDGLYSQLFNTSFAAGGNRSVTFLSGLSGDNFEITNPIPDMIEFSENEVLPQNDYNLSLWSGAYSTIYMANSLIQGAENSTSLDDETRNRLIGESKFIRAFTYFYLVHLYENVPLVLDTDYQINAQLANASPENVNAQILIDLNDALELTDENYPEDSRKYINSSVVRALLARVHLYQENWVQAEQYSSQVISSSNLYNLNEDLDDVFLINSIEALWQISPEGWGGTFSHTREGNLFVIIFANSSPVELSDDFMDIWEENDLRFINWVGTFSDETRDYNFPFKYKIQFDNSGGDITEYSTVFRLAEQYLIRSEARAKQGNLSGAIEDLDQIRQRSEIDLVSETNPGLSENELIELILTERRKEFFAEWGHRWLDLKRTQTVNEVLSVKKPLWNPTDIFYPIPEVERMKNPNLEQNEGY